MILTRRLRDGNARVSEMVGVRWMAIFKGAALNEKIAVRPSLWHCLWGAPFLLIGSGFFIYTLFNGITHATDSLTQVVVPGKAELSLQRGRTYTVFLEERSTVNGKIYSTTESIEGLTCRVNSVKNRASIGIGKSSANTSYEVNGRSGRSVLEFSVPEDGRYAFACDYDEKSTGPEVVVAVGAGAEMRILRTVLVGLGSLFGGCGGCVIVVVFVAIRRERAKKKLWQAGQAQF
jgi:hypothetical protein